MIAGHVDRCAPRRPDPRRRWALVVLTTAKFMVIMDTSVIAVARFAHGPAAMTAVAYGAGQTADLDLRTSQYVEAAPDTCSRVVF